MDMDMPARPDRAAWVDQANCAPKQAAPATYAPLGPGPEVPPVTMYERLESAAARGEALEHVFSVLAQRLEDLEGCVRELQHWTGFDRER